jgi:hypothetical protein
VHSKIKTKFTAKDLSLKSLQITPVGSPVPVALVDINWQILREKFHNTSPGSCALLTIRKETVPNILRDYRGKLGQVIRDLSAPYRTKISPVLVRFDPQANGKRRDNGWILARRTHFTSLFGVVNWEFLEKFRTNDYFTDARVTQTFACMPAEKLTCLYDASKTQVQDLLDARCFPLTAKAAKECATSSPFLQKIIQLNSQNETGDDDPFNSPESQDNQLNQTISEASITMGEVENDGLATGDWQDGPENILELASSLAVTGSGRPIQTGIRCNAPKDTEDRQAFDRIMESIIRFYSFKARKGEAQLVSLLWCPALQAAVINRAPESFKASVQFEVQAMSADLENQYVDFVAISVNNWYKPANGDHILQPRPPTFFVEASKYYLADDFNEKSGFFHKDYRKLIKSMIASMLHYWGVFAESPTSQLKLRIYGAFVAGTQIQYCVLAPIKNKEDPDGMPSFLFQTHEHWRVDITGKSQIGTCVQRGCVGDCELKICGKDLNRKCFPPHMHAFVILA